MSAPFNEALAGYTEQFAAAATRANRLALETAESAFGVQLKTFEKNVVATAGFLGEIAGAGNDSYSDLLPKGLQVARDNLERMATASHEVLGLGLKTTEALGELARSPFATTEGARKAR